jgi:hypothetical protein
MTAAASILNEIPSASGGDNATFEVTFRLVASALSRITGLAGPPLLQLSIQTGITSGMRLSAYKKGTPSPIANSAAPAFEQEGSARL